LLPYYLNTTYRVDTLNPGATAPARLERGEPPAETSELIGPQLGIRHGDFFDLHVAQYSRIHREALDVGAGRTGLATVVGKPIHDAPLCTG
jgi:hypothetical protein